MIIFGAGLSGLIAASMLRDQVSDIYERQQEVPNNHSALLRFRGNVVGHATGIEFRKVQVIKAIQPWRNPVADAIAYSMKCTGKAQMRSVVTANGKVEERYIAPHDLISRLVGQVGDKLRLDCAIPSDKGEIAAMRKAAGRPIISTIPMPTLMEILGWPNPPKFEWRPGTVIRCTLPEEVDFCATVYLPDPKMVPYRVSVTDNELIVEMAGDGYNEVSLHRASLQALDALGLTQFAAHVEDRRVSHLMKYSKISPISESIRRKFILWATEKHGIYSLGRFATWKPSLLLDDLVSDVRVIQRLSSGQEDSYRHFMKV